MMSMSSVGLGVDLPCKIFDNDTFFFKALKRGM